MAFNFWRAQSLSTRRTRLFLIAFALLTLGAGVGAEILWRTINTSYNSPLPTFGFLFIVFTLIAAGFNYLTFCAQGGKAVAEALGGKRVGPHSESNQERAYYNVCCEVALAAQLPLPAIYVLPCREINAFAAGLDPKKAVVAVTQGALQHLSRDELQAVVAHEFGHIDNGDMRLSLQLSAMLMGFFCLCYIGWRMFKLALYGRSSSKEKKTPPLFVIGLVVVAFGALGWLFGSFLKSMISKEREYLADACSAQFTRNPQALVRALRKIANFPMHDMPTEGMAYSHLYFNSSGFFDQIFATHPPLEKRISALESWQG